ncbi:MAG: hypothetical protein KatS3mg104_0157 [Phycisphaerae bacterium]|jgi:hypothetical protein|nr:MAG: hypothetical protein KatS3mg104_0157 [Phycisphaerae bacterium]
MTSDLSSGIEVRQTVDWFRRYLFLERSCIKALAGWFLKVPEYETKIGMGYQLWAHAERATELRARLQELRGGHSEANVEPALARVADEILNAPDPNSFLTGWQVLIDRLSEAYRFHLEQADGSANAQEVRILRRILVDIEQSRAWLKTHFKQYSQTWASRIQAFLDSAGGVQGVGIRPSPPESSGAHFVWPDKYVFDERICEDRFENYSRRIELPFEQRRIAEMEIFFNEFYAAGLLATILFDSWSARAPWEFYRDLAHHFWDEVRHAEFGMIRLKELGVQPSRLDLSLFYASQTMPFLHRLCYLTLGLEVYFMPRKRPRVERYGSAGDRRTQLFADVDWSDEGNHVQYGKRWVDYFLTDDARTVEDLQSEIADYLKAAGIDLPEGQLAPY